MLFINAALADEFAVIRFVACVARTCACTPQGIALVQCELADDTEHFARHA
jgi:hypothetical protein